MRNSLWGLCEESRVSASSRRNLIGGAFPGSVPNGIASPLPTAIASIALSLALVFGGLHFLSLKKGLKARGALLIGITFGVTATSIYANMAPRTLAPRTFSTFGDPTNISTPSWASKGTLDLSSPRSDMQQISGPVLVVIVDRAAPARVLIPRNLANKLAPTPTP